MSTTPNRVGWWWIQCDGRAPYPAIALLRDGSLWVEIDAEGAQIPVADLLLHGYHCLGPCDPPRSDDDELATVRWLAEWWGTSATTAIGANWVWSQGGDFFFRDIGGRREIGHRDEYDDSCVLIVNPTRRQVRLLMEALK